MWLYLTVFIISTILFFIGENKNTRFLGKTSTICGIVIPSLIAGFRAPTVGTDIAVYGIRFYNYAAESKAFKDLLSLLGTTDEKNDLGFHLVNFVLSRFSNNYHLGLFFYSFISISCVYLALMRLSRIYGISVSIGMMCYFLTLYNFSLNGMKQSIAIAIIFLAIVFLIEKNYKVYIALSIVAYFFHGSALISIPILCLYLILRDRGTRVSNKKLYGILFTLLVAFFIAIYLKNITSILIHLGLTRNEYMNYLQGGEFTQSNGIDMWNSGLLLTFFLFDIFFYKKCNFLIKENTFLAILMLFGFMTSIATMLASYLGRLSLYFILINISYQLIILSHFDYKSRRLLTFLMMVFIFIVWYHNIILLNYNMTLPYIFSLN